MACNKEPRVENTRLVANHQAKQTAERLAQKMAKKCEYCCSRVTLHWRQGHIICNECLLKHGIDIIARRATKTSLVEVRCGVTPKVSSEYDDCLHSDMPINVEQVKMGSRKMPSNARRGGGAKREVKNLQQWKTTDTPQRKTGPMRRGTLVNGHGVGRLKYDDDEFDPDYDPKVYTKFNSYNPYLNSNRSKPPRPPKNGKRSAQHNSLR